jgi:IS5 family transposase
MRRFAGVELAEDTIPDETTILRFRHLLEQHRLMERIFAAIRSLLEAKRLLLKSATIVAGRTPATSSSSLPSAQRRSNYPQAAPAIMRETFVVATGSGGFMLRKVFYTVPYRLAGHRLRVGAV